ncbi:MAG: type 4a pilus biogenesis protein PilO [Planctomycetota bacterium]|jgi:Tfp pilus assembly protein PilO
MARNDYRTELKKLIERLHDPVQLRVLITAVMVVVGYFAIYTPLNGHIEETTRKLGDDQRRQTLARDVEQLRAEVAKFQSRLPEQTDINEWVQYVLGGIRKFPLKLVNLDSGKPQQLGPFEAVVLNVELSGRFRDLDAFLHWLATNERLFRLDSAKIAPSRNEGDELMMQLTLLGAKA